MTEANRRWIDVISYTHGLTTYKGVLGISDLAPHTGTLQFRGEAGDFAGTKAFRRGSPTEPDFRFRLRMESKEALLSLAVAAKGEVTIVVRSDASATSGREITLENVEYTFASGRLARNEDGSFELAGSGHRDPATPTTRAWDIADAVLAAVG
jgi:hypothetical protein